MKNIESTRVVYDDIVQYVESSDGEYRVAVNDKQGSPAHVQAKERVMAYEDSARAAVWGRLIAKGAVRRMSGELSLMCRNMLGDEGCFYLFAPQNEDDCREFVTYAELLGCSAFARPWDYDDGKMLCLRTTSVVAGEKYVMQVTEDNWVCLYPVDGKQDTLAERMARAQDSLLAAFDGEQEDAE